MSAAVDTALALDVVDLRLAYQVRGIDRPVLRGVSLTIERGRSYGLVGESGCGKSTLGACNPAASASGKAARWTRCRRRSSAGSSSRSR